MSDSYQLCNPWQLEGSLYWQTFIYCGGSLWKQYLQYLKRVMLSLSSHSYTQQICWLKYVHTALDCCKITTETSTTHHYVYSKLVILIIVNFLQINMQVGYRHMKYCSSIKTLSSIKSLRSIDSFPHPQCPQNKTPGNQGNGNLLYDSMTPEALYFWF